MGWESITPAAVVVVLLGIVWKIMNSRIDEKATAEQLKSHVAAWERSQAELKEDIRDIKQRHDRELMEMNNRHDQNLRELRQEINGMSDRFDKRFDHIISLLTKTWGTA